MELTILVTSIALNLLILLNSNIIQGFSNTYYEIYDQRRQWKFRTSRLPSETHSHQVCLVIPRPTNHAQKIPYCDGSIISEYWVLTLVERCIFVFGVSKYGILRGTLITLSQRLCTHFCSETISIIQQCPESNLLSCRLFKHLLIKHGFMVVRAKTTNCTHSGHDHTIADYVLPSFDRRTDYYRPALLRIADRFDDSISFASLPMRKFLTDTDAELVTLYKGFAHYSGALHAHTYCSTIPVRNKKLKKLLKKNIEAVRCIEIDHVVSNFPSKCGKPGGAVLKHNTSIQIGIIIGGSNLIIDPSTWICYVILLFEPDIQWLKTTMQIY